MRPEPRFYLTREALDVSEIAETVSGQIAHLSQNSVSYAASIATSLSPGALVFVDNIKSSEALAGIEGICCLISEKVFGAINLDNLDKNSFVIVAHPKLAFAKIANQLHQSIDSLDSENMSAIHTTADIHDSVILKPNVYIGPGVRIGAGTIISSNVHLSHCDIGQNCRIQAGAVIGEPGFGFIPGPDGSYVEMPQLGSVVLEDNVSIGSNATIDRATFGETRIGQGTKIDNLVQIAHNCQIGRNTVIAAQTGISGSTIIGDNVMMGGKVGIADHLNIGDGVVLLGSSGVMKDIDAGEKWGGFPARPARQWLRETAMIAKLLKQTK